MQNLLTERVVSMSEFKRNPAAVLRQAAGRPVAVLNHNRVGFYLLEPAVLEALLQLAAPRPASPTEAMPAEPAAMTVQRLLAAFLRQDKDRAP